VHPFRPAGLTHEHRARVRPRRLAPLLGDAVVADHRRGEADELILEARIGDRLLVAGHAGREHGLAERVAVGPDRLPGPDRSVREREIAHSYATLPPATVMRTAPFSFDPSSHELSDREWKGCSPTVHSRSRSSRTRFALAPAATRGRSSPKSRAGPADIRSSSVSSGSRPGFTRCV